MTFHARPQLDLARRGLLLCAETEKGGLARPAFPPVGLSSRRGSPSGSGSCYAGCARGAAAIGWGLTRTAVQTA
jgi:hypothetical protein